MNSEFLTAKISLMIWPNRRKRNFKSCYEKRKFSENSVVPKCIVTKSIVTKIVFLKSMFSGSNFQLKQFGLSTKNFLIWNRENVVTKSGENVVTQAALLQEVALLRKAALQMLKSCFYWSLSLKHTSKFLILFYVCKAMGINE